MANGVRRGGFGRSLLFAVGAFILSNLGTAAMGWLSQLSVTPTQSAGLSAGIGLVVVFLTVILDSFKEPASAPAPAGTVYSGRAAAPAYPGYQPGYQQPYQQAPPPAYGRPPKPARSQRRVSWAVVVIVALALCGIGGFALTWGVQWLNGQAICQFDPKHYDGVQRLAGPAAAASGELAMEITGVMTSKCGTIVTVHAVNSGDAPLTVPVYKNATLTVPGRTSLGGSPFTSDWADEIPARGEMTGILVFKAVPDSTATVTLNFSTIYGRLGGPQGLSLKIPLVPVTES